MLAVTFPKIAVNKLRLHGRPKMPIPASLYLNNHSYSIETPPCPPSRTNSPASTLNVSSFSCTWATTPLNYNFAVENNSPTLEVGFKVMLDVVRKMFLIFWSPRSTGSSFQRQATSGVSPRSLA